MPLVPALGRAEAGELPCVQGQLGLKSEGLSQKDKK